MENSFDLGKEIVAELKKQGITSANLAKELGENPFVIKRFISKSSRQMELLIKISKLLNRDFLFELSKNKSD